MSSIRRLANSPYFIACFTLPDGKRTNRSTKTSDRRLASRLAEEWQTAADKAREGQFVEAQARKVLNEILVHSGQDPMGNETVASFMNQFLAGKDGSTAKRYAATVGHFLQHLADKASGPLTAIGHQDVLGYMTSREGDGLASKTLSVDMRTLNAAFNLARKLGLVMANPVERALALRPIAVESSQRECFSPEQVASLLNAAEGEWSTMILLGNYVGARLSDCANLRWENVNLVAGVIDYLPQKTRHKNKRVVVPIHPRLLSHLEQLASTDCPEVFLCPSLAGKSTSGKNGLCAQFNNLLEKADVDAQRGPGQGVRRFSKLSFHSLRHSFNSALANAGVSQETRMTLTGHSSVMVNGTYTHLDVPGLRSAVEKLPALV